jgi:hypothetical protein
MNDWYGADCFPSGSLSSDVNLDVGAHPVTIAAYAFRSLRGSMGMQIACNRSLLHKTEQHITNYYWRRHGTLQKRV